MIDLLLDLSDILGGFLLAIGLLGQSPRIGDDLAGFARRIAPFGWIVGIVALVTGGYFLIIHLTSGPHIFHFEVVGVLVGVALLWDRLHGRRVDRPTLPSGTTGTGLLLAIFGVIAIVTGIEGILTPD